MHRAGFIAVILGGCEVAVDRSAFAGKTITLELVVTATDPASTVTSASATIDQIEIQ